MPLPSSIRTLRARLQRKHTLARNRIYRAGMVDAPKKARALANVEKRIEKKLPRILLYRPEKGKFKSTAEKPSFEYWETRERELREIYENTAREIASRFTIHQLKKAANEEDGALEWRENGMTHMLGAGTAQLVLYLINERSIRRKELMGKRKRKQQFLKKEEKRGSNGPSPWH